MYVLTLLSYNTLSRKDKKMYVQCYKELSEKLPGPPTSLLLGDAYMNIQEVRMYLYQHCPSYMYV